MKHDLAASWAHLWHHNNQRSSSIGLLGVEAFGATPYHPALADKDIDHITYFLRDEPNYETIAALHPDLIVGSSFAMANRISGGTDTYEDIAPTVAFDSTLSVLEQVRQLGQLVGASERADLLINDFEGSLRALSDDVSNDRISIARAFGEDGLFVYTAAEPFTTLWVDLLGVEITPGPDTADERGYYITSPELITDLDGGALVVIRGLERLEQNPLWGALPAVVAGKVFDVGDYLVYAGHGGLGALLDQLIAIAAFLSDA